VKPSIGQTPEAPIGGELSFGQHPDKWINRKLGSIAATATDQMITTGGAAADVCPDIYFA
jgi:hypothetical protein